MDFKKKKAVQVKIVFMGTGSYAEAVLKSLHSKKYNIVAIFTKPNRKFSIEDRYENPIKDFAVKNKIKLFQPEKFDKEIAKELKNIKPDIIITASYGKIIPEDILKIPGFGSVNVHASLLPKYRGPSPIQNALLNGEKETGVTIMLMDQGMDTGDILSQKKIEIRKYDNRLTLSERLSELGSDLLLETLSQWIKREIEPKKQDNSKATVCQLIERSDGKIIWDQEASEIYHRFQALYHWPGIYAFWDNGDERIRIKLTSISFEENDPDKEYQTGEVFLLGKKVAVQTMKGFIVLEEVQIQGKRSTKIEDFINGYSSFVGSILK